MNDITITGAALRAIKRDLLNLVSTIDKAIELQGESIDVQFNSLPQTEKIAYILEGASRYFGISQEDIKRRINTGHIATKKRYVSKLLYNYCFLTQTEISPYVGLSRSAVALSLIKLEEQLSREAYGDARIRTIWASLIDYLKLPKLIDEAA